MPGKWSPPFSHSCRRYRMPEELKSLNLWMFGRKVGRSGCPQTKLQMVVEDIVMLCWSNILRFWCDVEEFVQWLEVEGMLPAILDRPSARSYM